LAGSEKVSKSGATGITLTEAQYTNKSLTMLGIVIKSLSERTSHIPYRDSKLTRILTDSLGGNSKTCLLITCSQASDNLMETISTLDFGSRTKLIKNKPYANIDMSIDDYKKIVDLYSKKDTAEIENYIESIKTLQTENDKLRQKIDELTSENEKLRTREKEIKINITTDTIAHRLAENKDEHIRILTSALEITNLKLQTQRIQYENIIYILKRTGGKSTNIPIKSPRKKETVDLNVPSVDSDTTTAC
jgi:kinesin family protein 5